MGDCIGARGDIILPLVMDRDVRICNRAYFWKVEREYANVSNGAGDDLKETLDDE